MTSASLDINKFPPCLPASWVDPCAYDGLQADCIPLLGLGLPIVGERYQDEGAFVAAIHAVTLPPSVDLGLRYPAFCWGGDLHTLSYLFRWWQEDVGRHPDIPRAECHPLDGLTDCRQLLPLLPIVNLPGAREPWIAVQHLVLLLWRLALGDIDLRALPEPGTWACPKQRPLPYRRPSVGGDVTIGHIQAFAARFPKLAKALMTAIPWTGSRARRSAVAGSANDAASELLGIDVDVRVGFLASPGEIQDAIVRSVKSDDDGPDHENLVAQTQQLVKDQLPTVEAPKDACLADSLRGAAWSCAVDAVLSGRDAHVGAW